MNQIKTWTDLSAASDSNIIAWARSQPWAQLMAECMQEPEWHAEGDVWTHTRMVCDALVELPQWATLSRRNANQTLANSDLSRFRQTRTDNHRGNHWPNPLAQTRSVRSQNRTASLNGTGL